MQEKLKDVPFDTLVESTKYLLGEQLTEKRADKLCRRLAANLINLQRGTPVPPWNSQPYAEWVPVKVLRTQLTRTGGGKIGNLLTFEFMAGFPCGLIVQKFWTREREWFFARNHLGFARKPGLPLSYAATPQLVSLRMYVLVEPSLCLDDEPGFQQYQVPPSIKTWNRKLLKLRLRRLSGFLCPAEFPHHIDFPCHHCEVGVDVCQLATLPVTLVREPCPSCNNPEAYFDPSVVSKICVNCARNAVLGPVKVVEEDEDFL